MDPNSPEYKNKYTELRAKRLAKSNKYRVGSSENRVYRRGYYLRNDRERYVGLLINGKRIRLYGKKRPHPLNNKCEICKRLPTLGKDGRRFLVYHHWQLSEKNPFPNKNILGLWLCWNCHRLAEVWDKNWITKYLANYRKLKTQITSEETLQQSKLLQF